jgi:hypothetical protein
VPGAGAWERVRSVEVRYVGRGSIQIEENEAFPVIINHEDRKQCLLLPQRLTCVLQRFERRFVRPTWLLTAF